MGRPKAGIWMMYRVVRWPARMLEMETSQRRWCSEWIKCVKMVLTVGHPHTYKRREIDTHTNADVSSPFALVTRLNLVELGPSSGSSVPLPDQAIQFCPIQCNSSRWGRHSRDATLAALDSKAMFPTSKFHQLLSISAPHTVPPSLPFLRIPTVANEHQLILSFHHSPYFHLRRQPLSSLSHPRPSAVETNSNTRIFELRTPHPVPSEFQPSSLRTIPLVAAHVDPTWTTT